MTLSERIARHNAKYDLCRCGIRHDGAAWSPTLGWHDHTAAPVGTARTLDALIPQSPFTRAALAGRLPAKGLDR